MAFIRKLRKRSSPTRTRPTVYPLTIWGIGYKFNDDPVIAVEVFRRFSKIAHFRGDADLPDNIVGSKSATVPRPEGQGSLAPRLTLPNQTPLRWALCLVPEGHTLAAREEVFRRYHAAGRTRSPILPAACGRRNSARPCSENAGAHFGSLGNGLARTFFVQQPVLRKEQENRKDLNIGSGREKLYYNLRPGKRAS